jgi:hypothetical protein
MGASILLAANKGLWGALGMGDFYYQLGVQIIQVRVSELCAPVATSCS